MKFLFDQSADFRLIAHLRSLGHDVSVVSRDYPPGLADVDVLAIALSEQRILVVADRDFGELIFRHGLAHAGVLFFRLPGAELQTKVEHLDQALQQHAGELTAGEFVVVTPGQIRVAGRPGS
jgi:predicted nuclease of predicted toxin-antitoxin system